MLVESQSNYPTANRDAANGEGNEEPFPVIESGPNRLCTRYPRIRIFCVNEHRTHPILVVDPGLDSRRATEAEERPRDLWRWVFAAWVDNRRSHLVILATPCCLAVNHHSSRKQNDCRLA